MRHTRVVGLAPQYRLDRYELLCAIGQGGMASVWAARRHDEASNELVAIKTILPEHAHDARFRAMFLDEGRIASQIEHPNVGRILDLGEEGDQLYLVMEWIDGDSLSLLRRRLIETRGEMPLGILLRILADLSGGLHAAHELCDAEGNSLSVVHRDVSPENILVDGQGVAKLIDFGVAKARDRAAEETKSGILKGKIAYMAPEQALKGQADRRADVWAVGAILYKFLSGKAPFQAENQAAALCLLVAGENPPHLPAHVHPAVAAVVDRALRHDPTERYATAAELQRALMTAMVEAHVPTTVEDVARFVSTCMADRILARRDAIAEAIRLADRNLPRVVATTGIRPRSVRRLDLSQEELSPTEAERDATTKVGGDVLAPLARKLSRAFDTVVVAAAIAGVFFSWREHRHAAHLPFVPSISTTAVRGFASPRQLADVPMAVETPSAWRDEVPLVEVAIPVPEPVAAPALKDKRTTKAGKSGAPAPRSHRK